MDRTTFFPKRFQYLFSFDFDAKTADKHPHILGNRVLVFSTEDDANERAAPVYNALGEESALGEATVHGRISLLEIGVKYPERQEYGDLRGRVTMLIDDGAVFDASYEGVCQAGSEWHWLTAAKPPGKAPEDVQLVETRACISLHFDTADTKYRWLVQYQCVAYGRIRLANGVPVSGTFDVHAMSVPNDVRQGVLGATG